MKLIKDGIVKEIKEETLIKAMIQVGWKEVKEKPVEKEEEKRLERVK